MLSRSNLHGYQRRVIKIIRNALSDNPDKLPGAAIAVELGGGKTVCVLTGLSDALDDGDIRKALIVAPLLVAQTVWPEEPKEWSHLSHLKPLLIRISDNDPRLLEAATQARQRARERFRSIYPFFNIPGEFLDALSQGFKVLVDKIITSVENDAVSKKKEELLIELVTDDTPIHVINREMLPWLWSYAKSVKHWPYDVMVVDDCREGRSGNMRAKRDEGKKSEAPLSRWGVMVHARRHMKALFQLTGTPAPKGLYNLWGLLFPIDLGDALGPKKTPFYEKYFYKDDYFKPTDPKPGAFDKIMDKVKHIMFSVSPEELSELPDFIVDPWRVQLPDKILTEYRRFKRTYVSEDYDVEALNGGALHMKLLQFANGSMFNAEGDDVWIHDCKLNALKEIVEKLDGTPLLVAYDFEFDKERILRAFPKDAVLLTPDNAVKFKNDWNADKIKIGVCHRASAGHGLNLQKGTGHICEYGLTTDAELYLQFLKRVLRPGRKTKVINHVIIAQGTIDEEVFPKYLDPKIANQSKILDEVRL